MRIHTDTLTFTDINDAAKVARVSVEVTKHGSRSRDHAFNVHLTGESRRRPNRRGLSDPDDYAATWDQWGVFLSVLFAKDERMTTPYYSNALDFDQRTGYRFDADAGFPDDYHGDHTFRYNGVPYRQDCTKCSAVQVWG